MLRVKASSQWHEATAGYAKVAGKWMQFESGVPIEDCHIFTVRPSTPASAGKVVLPAVGVKYVDWGDGTIERDLPDVALHDYGSKTSDFTVKAIFDWDNSQLNTSLKYLIDVKQFGLNTRTGKRNQIADGTAAFWYAADLADGSALRNLDTSNITTFLSAFRFCQNMNVDVTGWDVSNATSMEWMFSQCFQFNRDIGDWDTSKVTNMNTMFQGAKVFDQDLTGWCVSKIPTTPNAFADFGALAPEHYPKWGTCPGSDPASLTQTAAGTWKVTNYIGTAVYTAGPNATVSGDTISVTSGNADSWINVKYTNGVEHRTYVSRRQYTYHKENFPYPCGSHECNCREDWAGCHCGRDAPCDGPSWGQCGCPGEMCWYGRTRVCDQCTSYCDDWRDVRDGTPAGYTDQFGEWTRVGSTPQKSRKARKGDGRVELNGLRLTHVDGKAVLMGFFPVEYDSKNEELVNGGVKSASLLITDGGVAEGYWESNFDHDRFALVLMEADGSWGYMLHTDAPEWVQPGMAWQLLGHDLDLNVTVDMSGVVE